MSPTIVTLYRDSVSNLILKSKRGSATVPHIILSAKKLICLYRIELSRTSGISFVLTEQKNLSLDIEVAQLICKLIANKKSICFIIYQFAGRNLFIKGFGLIIPIVYPSLFLYIYPLRAPLKKLLTAVLYFSSLYT